ncbi:DnaJ domain-containing protein [Suttonella sp. R2A3]|uniref:DnaJ C-terminal domain-containing protein n=1 Tax=Suttonella sp. R2A3 TaxID=2908648 RepID=UPI001F1651F1|nr:DnaJ C-terminal domain-containing protein [Suttonella sp. R2A3]UJF24331.1 DnaJ domain-containing protein [Suttonella sp. R2A3]
MAQETYYDILGVSKNADDTEIKKAYRKLVRKYHPDVSKEADADEMTSKINQAYNVLKNKERRAEYDEQLNNPFTGGRATGQQHGFDEADFSQFGGAGGYQFRREDFGDGAPFGSGDFRFDDIFSAFGRAGARQQSHGSMRGEDQHAELSVDIDAAYHGAKRSLTLNVPTIDAQGRLSQTQKTLNVTIPKGISEGQQIRLAGQGLPGMGGGKNGDLFLKIRFHTHDHLYVDNAKDVHMRFDARPWQAALGEKVTIDTPAGKLAVTLPNASQQGQKIRLKGKGIPAKIPGDLYIHIHITMPPVQNDADKAAWQRLAEHYGA